MVDPALDHEPHGMNRLGRRFLAATLAVLGVAVLMIAGAAQAMFINNHDLRLLMWTLVPAVLGAAMVAMLLARPVARDAKRICSAAMRVADGDLTARTGVQRNDELGEAAEMFDVMVERLDAVERERALMLSSISHDLRTPLAALRASVEAIRDGVAPDPDQYLSGMERQVGALSSLVDDLQLHTRLISGTLDLDRTRLDLTELADEAMETLRPLATSRAVDLALAADRRVLLDADGSQLARVVRNLLDNAIRHAPAGTTVHVEVAVEAAADGGDPVDGEAGVATTDGLRRADGEVAVLRVVDDGAGFPAEFRERAFEPFTRADEARDVSTGTAGLGLSIAQGIVVAHGGTIGLGTGSGGVVEVRLPR
jgi:two-component system sensor histidine kinase BaeS